MDQESVTPEALTEFALGSFAWVQTFLDNLMRPWNAYQLAIAAGVFAAAYLLAAIVKPRMHDWMPPFHFLHKSKSLLHIALA